MRAEQHYRRFVSVPRICPFHYLGDAFTGVLATDACDAPPPAGRLAPLQGASGVTMTTPTSGYHMVTHARGLATGFTRSCNDYVIYHLFVLHHIGPLLKQFLLVHFIDN